MLREVTRSLALGFRGTAEDDALGAVGFIQHHHLEIIFSHRFVLEEFGFLLLCEGFEFDPASVKLKYIWV